MPPTLRAAANGVRLDNLTVAYRGHPAVQHLKGEFAAGSLTAVIGPNGAGKSTLLAAIAGCVAPAAGEVRMAAGLRGRVAWLPQRTGIDRSFPIRVFDVVSLGHWSGLGARQPMTAGQAAAVERALGAVGLAGFARQSIGDLSAGQFQRVLFARVLVQDALVILLDEPFSSIDARTTADLLLVVEHWHGEGRTVIAVLHDLDQVREHFDQALLLARHAVAWGPTAEVLSAENLLRARRQAESWDEKAAA